jgi:beta-lactamase regulating signal transducer with metallopeptidase domain
MVQTIIEILVFQLLFLTVYDVFLKNETFFNANRIYLLVTPILSLVLPFISLDIFRTEIASPFFQQLPTVFIGEVTTQQQTDAVVLSTPMIMWLVGAIIALLFLCLKVIQLYKLKQNAIQEKLERFNIYTIPQSTLAFSFFNTIYIGKDISEPKRKNILDHELVHIKEMHTVDLFIFEILRIVLWFNPLVYLFQKRLRVLHEYIADTKVAAQQTNSNYYQDLLTEVFQTQNLSFTNTFFNQSLIKKRIIMLHKNRSKSMFKLKYLLTIPLVCGILFYTSCQSDNSVVQEDTSVQNKIVELEMSLEDKGSLTKEEQELLSNLKAITNKEDTYLKDGKVEVIEVVETDGLATTDVPFSIVERVPTFQGCTGTNTELKTCMSNKVSLFVQENFDVKLAKSLGLSGIQKIYVAFKIDKTGEATDIKARAPHPELSEEATRVISKLPKMSPGLQRGKPVNVLYSLPIVFQIAE